MTRRLSITSIHNERLKRVRRLRRRPDGVFLLEGHRQLGRALESGARVREVYAAPELFPGAIDMQTLDAAERRGARVFELSDRAFRSISSGARADGIAAIVERVRAGLGPEHLGERPLLVVAESVERPGNLGTIIRTACSAGATGLVVCDPVTDVFHPETVRGSVGLIFHVPILEMPAKRARRWLRDRGIRVLVLSPGGEHAHWDADYSGAVALVVGSERYGVTQSWLDEADETLHVPMSAPADSLNVAVAAGVVLFEAVRQRASARG
jgi:TrmH family RNA methyltransferase